MHVHDDAFEAERPEHHAIADDDVRVGGAASAGAARRVIVAIFVDERVDRGARIAAQPARIAGRRRGRDVARRLFRQRGRLLLQVGDDRVDLGPRIAQALVELLVEPQLERLFALPQRFFAHARAAVGLAERLALALHQPPLVLERAQIGIDLGEVLGELRFALGQVLPRVVDDRRRSGPSRPAISSARLRPGDPY